MKTLNIKLPFFPGFYETWLEYSDLEYYAIKERIDYYNEEHGFETDFDDYTFDCMQRRQDCIDAFIDSFVEISPYFVLNVHKDEIVGPRNGDYNPWRGGHQDYLYCDVDFTDDVIYILVKFINDNYDWFAKKIKNDWTSYDGFNSFMENTVPEWIEELKSEDDRYVETTLAYYMMKMDDVDDDTFMYSVLDCIYDGSYVSLNDDIYKRFLEHEKDKELKEIADKSQLEFDFNEY